MIDGDVRDFVDSIHYGEELWFIFDGRTYFLRGWWEKGVRELVLDQMRPPADDYIWIGYGTATKFPVEEFFQQKVFNGKTFWEVEQEIKWIDYGDDE